MVAMMEIKGYEAFAKYIENIANVKNPVFLYFSGSKLPNGDSWCPDCVEAEPVVKAYLNELNREVTFVYIDVGERDYWKNKACPFRTDKRINVMMIPTLIKWKGVQRLEGSQCKNRELLQMMFEEED